MAYMNQERKAKIAERMKPILARHGLKGSLSVRNHSTIVLTVKAGGIDFVESFNRVTAERTGRQPAVGYIDVNPYHYGEHFDGQAAEFLAEAFAALNLEGDADGNFDKSDLQTDYYHVGWYVEVQIGRWNQAYALTAEPAQLAA